jgi:hypothetical protein
MMHPQDDRSLGDRSTVDNVDHHGDCLLIWDGLISLRREYNWVMNGPQDDRSTVDNADHSWGMAI